MLTDIQKRDFSFRVQRCGWPHSAARILLFTVNPPTSVEAERAFPHAGILCTKIRSRLSTRQYILCAFCAAIIATRGLGAHTPYVHCTCTPTKIRGCITGNLSIHNFYRAMLGIRGSLLAIGLCMSVCVCPYVHCTSRPT